MLECGYDMEGDRLYSVKWYRNGKEFYRHIPSDSPPTAVFSQPGLLVDVSTDNTLHGLQENIAGGSVHRNKDSSQESSAQFGGKLSVRGVGGGSSLPNCQEGELPLSSR